MHGIAAVAAAAAVEERRALALPLMSEAAAMQLM
jgi:hypothetical protein